MEKRKGHSGEKEENTVERHKTQLTVEKGTRHSGEKSRGLKKATNVGRGRYGGPPNKEGDFQANRTLQNGLMHTLPLHVTHDQSF